MTEEVTTTTTALDRGREAFEREAWATASDELTVADGQSPLDADDLERLSLAAYLSGRDAQSLETLERAHQAHLLNNDPVRAARCAFWLGMSLNYHGEVARAGGWIARGQRLVDDGKLDCAERGLLLLPTAFATLFGGGPAAAYEIFAQAGTIGDRFADRDLIALARHGQGQSLIRAGDRAGGFALIDEVMAAVAADEAGPLVTGLIYCAVIETCHDVFDLRRAHEWTAALTRWSARQPELVPFRGQCLVHRSQVMQQTGAWPEAMQEARQACHWLSTPTVQPALGAAMYQMGELHRLRGETDEAEAAYRKASECGHYPQPGLALLRLAQGRLAAAVAAIRGASNEVTDRLIRARILAAYVEIALVNEDVATARTASDELTDIADAEAPLLAAMAGHARGAVLLAEGEAQAALDALREASAGWRALGLRYDGARARVLIGRARRALGDDDTAELDVDAARAVFVELGAMPDLDELDRLDPSPPLDTGAGLSPRELQVLRLVATGMTNQAIAAELVLSERTVARHVSNIFVKLGLSSRSAATAYAYEHHMIG